MKNSKLLRPEYTSKMIGAVFLGMSVYLFFFTSYTNAALGAFFIGIFTLFIIHVSTVEEDTAIAELRSGAISLHELLEDLELSGKGVVVCPRKDLTVSRIYIPAGEFDELPDLYDEMTIVSGGRGKVGVSVVPPGKPLLDEAKQKMEYDMEGQGIEAARECMGYLSEGMELARSFSLREEDDKIKLRITLQKYDDYCEDLRDEAEKICPRTGCPICSAYLTAGSEALSKPLKITEFEKEEQHVKYTLEEV
ncbi:MAG: hypothetical protein KGY76_01585 [Candidatus Thermoplasmatota archaeon]|nr:hypothetical protein [Candidatus Thermoplasmatota archaeon]